MCTSHRTLPTVLVVVLVKLAPYLCVVVGLVLVECQYFIKKYSNEGDVILDNCMGSGSSIIACKNTRRQYIGIESNEGYFEKAEKWINSHY